MNKRQRKTLLKKQMLLFDKYTELTIEEIDADITDLVIDHMLNGNLSAVGIYWLAPPGEFTDEFFPIGFMDLGQKK